MCSLNKVSPSNTASKWQRLKNFFRRIFWGKVIYNKMLDSKNSKDQEHSKQHLQSKQQLNQPVTNLSGDSSSFARKPFVRASPTFGSLYLTPAYFEYLRSSLSDDSHHFE